jgi:excisionase family DNA binding protein
MASQTNRPMAYTVNQALAEANCGRTKFYEEVNAGRIKTRRLGRRVLILADDLKAWLESLPETA